MYLQQATTSYNKLQQATTSYNKLQQATTSYNKLCKCIKLFEKDIYFIMPQNGVVKYLSFFCSLK